LPTGNTPASCGVAEAVIQHYDLLATNNILDNFLVSEDVGSGRRGEMKEEDGNVGGDRGMADFYNSYHKSSCDSQPIRHT
jgi:hypothetical protein